MREDSLVQMLKVKVKFRPTGKPERGRNKSITLEAYCPFCEKTLKEYGQEQCQNCKIGLDWDFAIAWD